jgi:hypothetical protein
VNLLKTFTRKAALSFFLLGLVSAVLASPCSSSYATTPPQATPQAAGADSVPEIHLGQEYTKYNKTSARSGSSSSGGFSVRSVLLYVPNRLVDLLDIFRCDVGVGPAAGGVLRLSKYAQMGYRGMHPFSLRVGLQGRHSPVFVETSNEFGVGPAFVNSRDRRVQTAEIGAGLDLFLAGAYLGIDLGAIPDFFAGIFGFDPDDDDFK